MRAAGTRSPPREGLAEGSHQPTHPPTRFHKGTGSPSARPDHRLAIADLNATSPDMNRRTLLRLALLPPLLAPIATRAQGTTPPSPQDAADLGRIEAYLNGIHTLQAHFLQVAPDGAMSQGTAWLERPGRMRFQYDPPAPFLLVAAHGNLVFEDRSINQVSNVPLSLTPLGILLAERVNLSGDVRVMGLQRLPGQLQVTVVRSGSPQDGSLTLLFTDSPLALRQWTVLDAQRRETRVTLYNVEQGVNLDPKLFEFVDPRNFQNSGGGG
jgi:outer membrane lipoprotein-sorting protein